MSASELYNAASYPSPGSWSCQSSTSRHLCDAAGVFKDGGDDVITKLKSLENSASHECGSAGKKGWQMAVGTMQGTRPAVTSASDMELMTREVFNRWGIGNKECNDGILFLLSINDRKNHIKTGSGARAVLTDNHIKDILSSAKPLLRAGQYDKAIRKVVDRCIDEALRQNQPPFFYRIDAMLFGIPHLAYTNWALTCIVLFILGIALKAVWDDHRTAARKASFERKLRRLQGARDKLNKRGDVRDCPCPICLEDLPSGLEFSDGRLDNGCELLRCGHVFHQPCISHWLRSKQTCPVCRIDKPDLDQDQGVEDTQDTGKQEGSHERAGGRGHVEPDQAFWAFTMNRLASDYNDVTGVERLRRHAGTFDTDDDWYSNYQTAAREEQAEMTAAAEAATAQARATESYSGDSADFGGGSCDGGGGGGGDW